MIYIVVIILLVSNIASFMYIKCNILNPAIKINDNIKKMECGDLTKKIEAKKMGKLVSLGEHINNLILKIRSLIAQSMTMSDKVIIYSEELDSNLKTLEVAANETSSAISEISNEMTGQMDGVLRVREYVCNVVENYKNIVDDGRDIENSAKEMICSVDNGKRVYDELVLKIDASAKSNVEISKKLEQLEVRATKIQGISDTVKDISKNTNLLSLNASIEASRAGEAGRGFAVVAEEIRKLAQISATQADEIQSIIDSVKNEIFEIVSVMNIEVDHVKEYISFSDEVKISFEKIYGESSNTLESIQNINQTINYQNGEIIKVEQIVDNIAKTSENITAATQEVAASSQEQVETMGNIFNSISSLIDMNKDIKNNIESFAKNYEIDSKVQKYIDDSVGVLKKIAQNSVLSTMDYNKCTPILKTYKKEHPYFDLFAIMQEDGLRKAITLDYSKEEVYVNFGHRPYFKEAINGKDYKSQPYISVDTNNYCLAISTPVKNEDGKIVGILMADLVLG